MLKHDTYCTIDMQLTALRNLMAGRIPDEADRWLLLELADQLREARDAALPKLSPAQTRCLELVRDWCNIYDTGISTNNLRRLLGMSAKSTRAVVGKLSATGLIRHHPKQSQRFRLTSAGTCLLALGVGGQ